MADVFSKEKRSEVMSHIRGKGNRDTELEMIKILKSNHITGWRRNQKVIGKPDFIFWKERVAVFVDGCFWHCCPEHSNIPKNNHEFWEKKLRANIERDRIVTKMLEEKNWIVIRFWEHEMKDSNMISAKIISELSRKRDNPKSNY